VPSTLLETVTRARKSVELRPPLNGEEGQVKDAVQCATRLKRTRLLQLNTELQYVLHEAETTGNVAEMQQLMRKLLANQRQLRTIDSATHLQG
jgi:DNA primase